MIPFGRRTDCLLKLFSFILLFTLNVYVQTADARKNTGIHFAPKALVFSSYADQVSTIRLYSFRLFSFFNTLCMYTYVLYGREAKSSVINWKKLKTLVRSARFPETRVEIVKMQSNVSNKESG